MFLDSCSICFCGPPLVITLPPYFAAQVRILRSDAASGALAPAALGRVRVVASVHPTLSSFMYSQAVVRPLPGEAFRLLTLMLLIALPERFSSCLLKNLSRKHRPAFFLGSSEGCMAMSP
jgi:hypothetical protein